ncbi:CHAT domain-containing protein [Shimia biformata]|uniref:CHAT domain-containing protein n=1 Tax=Shimia biformata TaxID=1294299 RepID=UPI0019520BF8|nr:CHAT domain-containing protein [Shimia biformata]
MLIWPALAWANSQPELTPEGIRDDVFFMVQRGKSSVAAKALQQAALRQEAGNPRLAALLRRRQDMTDRQKEDQTILSEAVGQSGRKAEVTIETIKARMDATRAEIDRLDREIEEESPSFKELTNPRPMTRAEVQDALGEDEALILTLTGFYETYVWAISKDSADWTVVYMAESEIASKVKLLRQMLDVTSANRSAAALDDDISASVDEFDRHLAHELYVQFLKPLEHVFGDARHLITVVDGPLTSLPLAVLVGDAPEGENNNADALRDTDWLIRRYALTTLPNVSSLRALRRSAANLPTGGTSQPFVGFGDPIFRYREVAPGEATGMIEEQAGFHGRGVFEKVSEVARLAQLPNTRTELRRLAQLTGVGDEALYLGAAASETAVKKADLSGAEILAFATHGLLAGGLDGLEEPALVFTPPETPSEDDDALLTASEAAELKLSAKLIILSACNTAGSDGTPGAEGLSGLARAFIYAGARSILVSHWPVDDYATSVLTTGMVGEMANGTSRGEALRQSILKLMNDDDPRHTHPRYWAPFVLVGEG